ncbi:MAG: glycine cleavage system protein GcvH [Gammaproteobacteria bacterium]|nr:glycine cleavage system protein GcvH [Gammaproteobacteria bacterium]
MNDVPAGFKYTQSHEWVSVSDDGIVTVGITDHAQQLLGDLVYVEIPEEGTIVKAGEPCAVVESVKAASDVYAPVSGEVVARNSALEDAPEQVNQDAFGEGWIFRIKMSNPGELKKLLDADTYADLAASESH